METALANAPSPGSSFSAQSPRLPGLTATLTLNAAAIAAHARPLLLASNTTLLSVTRLQARSEAGSGAGHLPRITVRAWNEHGRPVDPFCAIEAPNAAQRRAMAALRASAALVLDELAGRWPINAEPPAIGVVTDGIGVAFSADHPSPLAPGWLAQQLQGTASTSTLLAFAPSSSWARLSAPAPLHRLN